MIFKPLKMHDIDQKEIPFFGDFAAKYSSKMPNVNRVFVYYESTNSSDPFSINNRCLYFNNTIWRKIGFTTEELEAMLAHEMGHAFDPCVRTDNNQPEREDHADDFAVVQNLGGLLCSALYKCITSGIYTTQEEEEMKRRIIRIHYEKLNHNSISLKNIHSKSKREWLIGVYSRWDEIRRSRCNADKVRILEAIASQIKGIGQVTVYKTLTWFN